MTKKIIVAATVTLLTTSLSAYNGFTREHSRYYSNEVSQYERGFAMAIHALNREVRDVEMKYETFDEKYIVYLDIRKMPKEHIMISKNYAIKEGYHPVVTKTKMIITGVDRVSDAKQAIRLLKHKYFYGKTLDYQKNTEKTYKVYNYLFKSLFKKINGSVLLGKNVFKTNVMDDFDQHSPYTKKSRF